MRVIVAGSRTITEFVHVAVAIENSGWKQEITEVVCGASEEDVRKAINTGGGYILNVDILGAAWAIMHRIPVAYFPPDWDNIDAPGAVIRRRKDGTLYNAAAGPMRNELMAQYGEGLILVWTGNPKTSKGSADMLRRAKAHYPPERIYQHIVRQAQP